MKIYVVEIMGECDMLQIGFSTSKKVAEEIAQREFIDKGRQAEVTEYKTDKNNWCYFD